VKELKAGPSICRARSPRAAVGVGAQQRRAGAPPPQPLTMKQISQPRHGRRLSKAGTIRQHAEYIVQCSNRTGPGVVEITRRNRCDLVIDGTATFVTGGKALNVTATNPLQPRGTDIRAERFIASQGRCDRSSCGAGPLFKVSASAVTITW